MFYKKNKTRRLIWSSIFSLFIVFSLFLFSNFVLASDVVGTEFVEGEIALSSVDPRALATRIINISLSILGIVAVSIVIYGGFVWMTAEGNEERIAKAKGILKAGVIGLAIVLASWGIASLVLRQLGGATGVSQSSCVDGETRVCGFEGVSTCQDGSWGPCIGSGGIPGGYGSSCSKPENPLACSSITLCNSGFVCGDNCTCEYEGQGDPCNEGASCGMGNNTCQENLFCDQNSCTCEPINEEEEEYSELNDPCNDGGSCSAVDNSCNPSHGLSCNSDTCTCVGSPVIANISPRGGFCENLPETPCSNNDDCGGGLCNISTPNGALGNLITISGYNFDNYVAGSSAVNLIYKEDGEDDIIVAAQVPGDLNATCGDSWSNEQIIVAIPSGSSFVAGNEIEIEVITGTNKTDRSRDENGPELDLLKINNIIRPGLCGVSNPGLEGLSEGKMNDELFYSGLNLSNSKAYFGNSVNNVVGFSPNNFTEDTSGLALVPGLSSGEVSTFAKKSLVFSNFVDFKKLPEPPQGPSISFFEPSSGSSGQYITIYGNGFGNFKGISDIYFSANGVSVLADYNFPSICLQSIWSDNQILIKVPENIDNGDYNIVAKIGSWEEIISSQEFSIDDVEPLKPSLCKISPTSGPHNSIVNLWGEYFGEEASAVFSVNKNSNNSEVLLENGASRILVNVPQDSVSGPVSVSRDGLIGNSLNFSIGVCVSNNDCPNTQICCGNNTSGAGTCVTNANDCDAGSPDNSVFEWKFTTGLSTTNPSYDGDEAYSCASYNFCPDVYVCPNSPGLCSNYAGGQNNLVAGSCDDSCNSAGYCDNSDEADFNNCSYDENLDKCVLNDFKCSLVENVEYNLDEGVGTTTKEKICKNYTIDGQSRNYYEISVNTICPTIAGVTWTMISPGKCVDTDQINSSEDNSTCLLCPSTDLSCQHVNLESSYGLCVSPRLCQDDFSCLDGSCQKEDPASCQCCCDKENNDPTTGVNSACCAPLTCDNSCGISANSSTDEDNQYGLCSGCDISDNYATNDSACNCLGTSGKYCEVNSTYPTGACLDCSALQLEDTCRAHSSQCCWDSVNDACRSGVSDSSVWGGTEGDPAWIGLCPYYGCQLDNPTHCASEYPKPSDTYPTNNTYPTIYSSLYLCDAGCQANCSQITSSSECSATDNCCWDNGLGSCKTGTSFEGGVNDGQCKYFTCTDPGNNVCSETLDSSNGNSDNFSNSSSCLDYCEASPDGLNQYCSQTASTTEASVCDNSVCNQFDCLNEEGELGGTTNNCGTCCCNPNAEIDKCGQINSSLTCLPNKGLCTGDNRGLCCGCSSDASCVGDTALPEFVGCGMDTCCKARPKIEENLSKNAGLNVFPEHKSNDVCRNSIIEINFDQRMDVASLQDNILLLEETSGICSSGTYFIGQADLENNNNWNPLKFIKNIFVKTFNSLAKIFGGTALASPSMDKNYCAVLGTVDFEHLANNKTRAYFKPENLLKPGAKYFVVVKGDEALNSGSGVKSSEKIGMNGLGYFTGTLISNNDGFWLESSDGGEIVFNNVYYQNSYIWEFNTQDVSSLGQGICTIDYVTLSPSSYLFQSTINDINENDQDSNNLSFDSVKDRDKIYSARAYSADNQIIQPTAQYDWTWDWNISNENVLVFYDDLDNNEESDIIGFSLDGNKRLVGAKDGITDGQANVSVTTILSSPYTTAGNNISRTVPAYVMICNNPWPAFNGETWEPWKDKEINSENENENVGQYNYEFYYCRDSGDQGTADDLPAFLSDRDVTKGNSLVRVCSNAPSQTCSNSSDCPSGGLCLASFLKETYFFKERIPHFIENVSATDNGTGGSLKILWESEKALVDKYKIYYSFPNNSNQQQKIVDPEIECGDASDTTKYSCQINLNNLTNNQQYAIRVTAISENLAETNFSATAFGTPTESGLEQQDLNIPLDLQAEVLSTTSRTVKLTWGSPVGYSVSSYKVYRGVSSLNYGASFLTNNSDTEIT
ncbi:MAG TPA: IPT/TIG domain-containing protein, partial [bacterium]|nr:IPT/TIG domain-containing protein [bacterium]